MKLIIKKGIKPNLILRFILKKELSINSLECLRQMSKLTNPRTKTVTMTPKHAKSKIQIILVLLLLCSVLTLANTIIAINKIA